MNHSNDVYKPVVPKWVAEILEKKKRNDVHCYSGQKKKYDRWEERYSRKYKYAMLNGWMVEEEAEQEDPSQNASEPNRP